jgi:hypothetical protein
MENSMEVPKKLKIEVLHDPAIPFLGMYSKDGGMDLKDIILCEISQAQKDKHIMTPFICGILKS